MTVPDSPTPAVEGARVPVWLLDIDGVINAAVRPKASMPTHAWPASDWIDTKADGRSQTWRIVAATSVLDFIRSVHHDGLAEIRWHTTWQELSTEVAEALDLPEFSVQEAPEFDDVEEYLRRDRWWKLPAVWRVLRNEGRRVVWTDDDASTDLTTDQNTRLAAAGCLIVSPDPMTGLCSKHLRKIAAFLDADPSWARDGVS